MNKFLLLIVAMIIPFFMGVSTGLFIESRQQQEVVSTARTTFEGWMRVNDPWKSLEFNTQTNQYINPCVQALWDCWNVPVNRTAQGPATGGCCGATSEYWNRLYQEMPK
jgi:hypothetical protein